MPNTSVNIRIIFISFASICLVAVICFFACASKDPFTKKEREFLMHCYGTPEGKLTISSFDDIDTLDFGYRDNPSEFFYLVEKSPNLDTLLITHARDLNDGMFSRIHLNAAPKLKTLDLTWTSLSEKSVDTINKAPGIETLRLGGIGYFSETKEDVGYPRFSDRFLKELKAPKLRELNISEDTVITDDGLSNLKKFPDLEEITFDSEAISSKGLLHLQKCMKLKGVTLSSPLITDDGLQHLQKLPELEKLIIRSSLLTDDGLIHLLELPSLKTLNLASPKLSVEGVDNYCDQYLKKCGNAKVLRYRVKNELAVIQFFEIDDPVLKSPEVFGSANPNQSDWTVKGGKVGAAPGA